MTTRSERMVANRMTVALLANVKPTVGIVIDGNL